MLLFTYNYQSGVIQMPIEMDEKVVITWEKPMFPLRQTITTDGNVSAVSQLWPSNIPVTYADLIQNTAYHSEYTSAAFAEFIVEEYSEGQYGQYIKVEDDFLSFWDKWVRYFTHEYIEDDIFEYLGSFSWCMQNIFECTTYANKINVFNNLQANVERYIADNFSAAVEEEFYEMYYFENDILKPKLCITYK